MENANEITKLVWHKNENHQPMAKGWYLCKIYDLLACDQNGENCKWGEPYYSVVWFDKVWDCDGVPAAWAQIPECNFDVL